MSWVIGLLLIVVLLLIFIAIRIDHGLALIRGSILAASDLNLEAHARLLDHFDGLERDKARERHEEFMRTR